MEGRELWECYLWSTSPALLADHTITHSFGTALYGQRDAITIDGPIVTNAFGYDPES